MIKLKIISKYFIPLPLIVLATKIDDFLFLCILLITFGSLSKQ